MIHRQTETETEDATDERVPELETDGGADVDRAAEDDWQRRARILARDTLLTEPEANIQALCEHGVTDPGKIAERLDRSRNTIYNQRDKLRERYEEAEEIMTQAERTVDLDRY